MTSYINMYNYGGHKDKNDPQDLHLGDTFQKTTLRTSVMGAQGQE